MKATTRKAELAEARAPIEKARAVRESQRFATQKERLGVQTQRVALMERRQKSMGQMPSMFGAGRTGTAAPMKMPSFQEAFFPSSVKAVSPVAVAAKPKRRRHKKKRK